QVTFKILEDEDARVAGIRAGTLDYVAVTAIGKQRLASEKSLVVTSIPRQYNYTFVLNHLRKPWSDVKVRQAINLGLNRQDVADKAFSGDFTISSPVPPSLGGDWTIPRDQLLSKYYMTDPAKARQMFKEAG